METAIAVFLGVYLAIALAVYWVYKKNDLLVYPGGMSLIWPATAPFIIGCLAYFGVRASRRNIEKKATDACKPEQEQPQSQAEKRAIEKTGPAKPQSETSEPAAPKEKRVPKINKPVTQEKISEVNVDEIEIDI